MFLSDAEPSEGAQRLFDDDLDYMGFVMNGSRLWAWQPEAATALFDLMGSTSSELTMRERGILVAATASAIDDSYCSLAWGGKLSNETDAATAAAVIEGTDEGLTDAEAALAGWARKVSLGANSTTQKDVDRLRAAGLTEAQIFGATVFVALRIGYAKVNEALGAVPDGELRGFSPPEVVRAVDFGRPMAADS